MSELRYVTNIHGMTGDEEVNVRVLKDCAVLEFGGINIFADDWKAFVRFGLRLLDALEANRAAKAQ